MKLKQKIFCWKKIKQGDQQSFTSLFNCHWEALFQYAYRVLKNKEDAEEVVQELFIHLWKKKETFPDVQSIPSYLFTALKNRTLNHLAKKRLPCVIIDEAGEIVAANSASDIVNRKDVEKILHEQVSLLPQKMRQVYTLYHFGELNIDEIALSTGNSPQTVRNQLNIASKKMKLALRLVELLLLWCFFNFFL